MNSSTKSDVVPAEQHPSDRQDRLLAVLFQLGLGLFVLGEVWQLCGEQPFFFDNESLVKLVMICLGIGLVGSVWISALRTSALLKVSLISAFLGLTGYQFAKSASDLDAFEKVLRPAKIDHGRWVHEGLGLSFAMPAGWQLTNARPSISDSNYSPVGRDRRQALYSNEYAVYAILKPAGEQTISHPSISSIRIEAARFRFPSLTAVATAIYQQQSAVVLTQGIKMLRRPFLYRINNIDFAEFSFFNEKRNSIVRSVFARSGGYMLFFHLEAVNEQEFNLFDEFIKSVQITNRQTLFTE